MDCGLPVESCHGNVVPCQGSLKAAEMKGSCADFCSCFVKWPFIVSFPMKNGDFPVRYVKLPEGKQFCYCGSKLNKVEHTYTDSQKSA